jgi:hypothetical protein
MNNFVAVFLYYLAIFNSTLPQQKTSAEITFVKNCKNFIKFKTN